MCIKLSIVVPVYNVENYIEECANSIFQQLNDEVECIFINDGSTDNSLDVLKKCINNYNENTDRIKIINKINQGVSSARNLGIQQSKGYFIAFLDSDDILLDNYITKVIQIIDTYPDIDFIHFNALSEYDDGRLKKLKFVDTEEKILTDKEYLMELFKKNQWYPWLRIYNKNILRGFKFPENYVYEDIISIPFLYGENIKIYCLNQCLLKYRFRPSSITRCEVTDFHLNSVLYGINIFRNYLHINYMRYVYFDLVLLFFRLIFKLNFVKYKYFLSKIDLNFLMKQQDFFQGKLKIRLMLHYPKFFYFYKNRLGLKHLIN